MEIRTARNSNSDLVISQRCFDKVCKSVRIRDRDNLVVDGDVSLMSGVDGWHGDIRHWLCSKSAVGYEIQ